MSSKFTFEYTTTEDEIVLVVEATHYQAEKGSRDQFGAPMEPDYDAEITDFEILRAYSVCSVYGIEISQVKPELTKDLINELLPIAWEQYECAEYSHYEYEQNY